MNSDLFRVPVLDEAGNMLGKVSPSATSIAAAKLAGRPCKFACINGRWVWIAKPAEAWTVAKDKGQ